MFRKTLIAAAAVLIAGTAFTATDASAKPMGWKGGKHHHHHHHGRYVGPGLALGVIGAATIAAATAPRCYEVMNRWGEIVTRCRY